MSLGSFVDQTNLKIIWKFSLSQCRCLKTPIDVENCVKSALNSNNRKQNFTVITNWGGGNYQLRSALAAKTDLGGCDYYLRNSGLPPSYQCTISKGLAYIITLYTITSLTVIYRFKENWIQGGEKGFRTLCCDVVGLLEN